MPPFIQLTEHLIINANHIIDAAFEEALPERDTFDEEEEKKTVTLKAQKARLKITTTEVVGKETSDYEGNPVGAVTNSRGIEIRGERAERVWADLCAMAYVTKGETPA